MQLPILIPKDFISHPLMSSRSHRTRRITHGLSDEPVVKPTNNPSWTRFEEGTEAGRASLYRGRSFVRNVALTAGTRTFENLAAFCTLRLAILYSSVAMCISLCPSHFSLIHSTFHSRTSLDTSEELRKRVAVLSAYYENVVERMQANLNEVQLEKNRMATDLATQIVRLDEAHRRTVEDMERRFKQKEKELAAVKEVQL